MSWILQKKLKAPKMGRWTKPGQHSSDDLNCLIAKYCPPAPHNTNQFLISQHENSNQAAKSICYGDALHWSELFEIGGGSMTEEREMEEGQAARKMRKWTCSAAVRS
jgi:hypothetical protein